MAQDQMNKTVRVIANVNNRNLRTVNVVATRAAVDIHSIRSHKQQSGALPAGSTGYCETVQDSGGTVVGLPTMQIPGYVGPS